MQALERSFVRIYNGDPTQGGKFTGTAFFIKPQSLLTAAHVVRQCENGVFLQNMPDGGTLAIPANSISYCQTDYGERDVAILHTSCTYTVFPVPLAGRAPQMDDTVTLHGFFDTQQSLHQRQTHISGYVNVQHAWNIADGVKPGMSGGAVIREGELLGLIQARDEESKIITYCIPIDEIRTCLGESIDLPEQAHEDETEWQRVAEVFVGRTDELQQLKSALLHDQQAPVAITALHGMPGVGKSWLADYFYASHRDSFPGGYERLTLNAENPEDATLLLSALAEKLGLSGTTQQLISQLTLRLKQPRTLLHIENVDSDQALLATTHCCRQLPGCHIILTGRMENFGKARRWQQISLKPFIYQDALTQLNRELKWLGSEQPEEQDAARLINTLGGLPLAIHLAAGYLAAGSTVDEFIEELHSCAFDLPPEDASDASYTRDQMRAVLHSTFQLSLRLLCQQAGDPQADESFTQLGFAPLGGFGAEIANAITDLEEGATRRLLRLAQKLSLIELIQLKPLRWQLHPLFADYLRQHAADSGGKERLHQWFLKHLTAPEANQTEQNTRWQTLNIEQPALNEWLTDMPPESQVEAERTGSQYATRNGPFAHWMVFCQNALRNTKIDDQQRSNILFTLAQVAHSSGNPDIALNAAEEKHRLDTNRQDEREAAIAQGQIADILQARGNLDEALRIRQQEELPVYESLGEVRSIAITKGQIADILTQRGNLDEALRIRQQEELPVYESLGEVREIAITKGKIADILTQRGNLDEALRIRQQEELPVYESLGEVRSIAITKGKIADILTQRGNLDEALRIRQQEELPVYESLGEVRSIAITKGKIADILTQRGNLDEALRIRQQEELPVYESLGEVRSIAITKGQIADILTQRGNLDEALRIRQQEELPVYESLGEVRSIAITKGKIADILTQRGNLDEALRIRQQEELPVYESLGEVRSIAITKGKIADILTQRGNLDEALRIRQQEELPVYESLGEVRSIAITKGKIADILTQRGNLDEALRIRQQEELPVYESLGEVRSIAITKGKIADILTQRGNLDEALRIRQQEELPVYESLGEVRSIAITKGKIADILTQRGNLDEALRIRQQEELPVYESLGEVRSIAITKGKIADILTQRGNLDEALRIRQQEELPVYESLGEVRSIAITKGQIADILTQRGNLDEALRIRTEDQLPVYESLGEVRSIAITKGKIADILTQRGNLDEALRIRTEDQLPVYESLGEVRSIAITKGKIADILFLQNQQEEAISLYENDVLPIYEQLTDKRMLLVDQANLAMMYLQTGKNHKRAKQLLCASFNAAQEMQIPEAGQIQQILDQLNMTCS